jgi:serine/threonine protein phosphatase PrpC
VQRSYAEMVASKDSARELKNGLNTLTGKRLQLVAKQCSVSNQSHWSRPIPNHFPIIADWISTTVLHRSQQLIFDQKAVIATDLGVIRSENQDRVAVLHVPTGKRPFVCFALSDGMGGMKDGGECATSALAAFFESLIDNSGMDGQRKLHLATRAANDAVFQVWQGKGGATLSAILIETDQSVHIANVGDSRVYALAGDSKTVRRVTVDDNLKEAFGGTDHGLVQFIGIGKSLLPKIEQLPPTVSTLVITSDGAHYFDQHTFDRLLVNAAEPLRVAERLLALARWLGGPDNASVAAFKVSDVLNSLRTPRSKLPTIWSGVSQLHLDNSRLDESSKIAPSPQPEPQRKSELEPQQSPEPSPAATESQRHSSKRKIRLKKKNEPDAQLEINISSDGNDDASDS